MTEPLRFLTRRIARWYDPYDVPEDETPPQGAWAYARWTLWPVRGLLAVYAALSLSIGLLEVGIVAMIGGLVDRAAAVAAELGTVEASAAAFFEQHWLYALGLFAMVGLLRPLIVTAQGATMSLGLNPGLPQAAIWRLHRHALRHSLTFFQDDFAGRLAQKEMQAGAALYTIVTDTINAFGMLIAFTIAMIVALAIADPLLALPVVVWVLAYIALLRVTLPRIRAAARNRADVRAGVTGQVVDSFANIATVKLFAHGAREEAAARQALDGYRGASFRFGAEVTMMRFGLNLLNALLMVATLGVALWLWRNGADGVTMGVAAAAGMLAFRATGLAGWIAFTALSVFAEIGTLEDAIDTLAPPHGVTDKPDAVAPPRFQKAIAFEDVGFQYGRRAGGVSDVSLRIEAGEKIGLVGRSGAGKSTLVSLLLRLYDVEDGRVTLDGVDVRDLAQDGLRRQVATIRQETSMFNRSVMENILYGDPSATPDAAIAAAKAVSAHDFIVDLQDHRGRRGYEARIGDQGVKLSGGQRQRIALARVVLKNAPILVLDEATSALDSEVEAAILETMETLMADRTVIAIAHRLSTIAQMDRIVVLDQGRIVEQGPHSALIAAGGLYAKLWSRQSGGFLGEDRTAA